MATPFTPFTPFTLVPATPTDIPALAQISARAFLTDTHTQLKGLVKNSTHAEEMTDVLSMWMSSPQKTKVMKAISPSNEILGWICWYFNNFSTLPPAPAPAPPKTAEHEREEFEEKRNPVPEAAKEVPKTKIQQLGAVTRGSMWKWVTELNPPGKKTMNIGACLVDPAHQGRGVGRAMMKWGTDQADEARVYSWVSSSQGGAPAFAKAGFEEIGDLTVNLDDYADGVRNPEAEDGKWGEYTFHTMKRPVKSP